jgi:hypothetical protein
MALLLNRDRQRCRLPVLGFRILPELPVEFGQLFVELAPGLGELVEAHPALGVAGMVLAPVGGAA